jgi:serine/threonine-protein kinase
VEVVGDELVTEEFGPYTVFKQLGLGGMAMVDLAENRGSASGPRGPVALKRLLPEVAAKRDFIKQFVHEGQLACYLNHPNIAKTHDLGRVNSTYFIAMEYIAGPTLLQIIKLCLGGAGPIPIPIAVHILTEVAAALDYAHNLHDDLGRPLGIIHRDISPANIIVSEAGVTKLIDFGIAKTSSSQVRTQAGHIKGKLGYLAPEYIEGQLDPRVDLFAFGVVAHELLSMRRLFGGRNDLETAQLLRSAAIVPPSRHNPRVSSDLDDIVMTALQRNPKLRWQNAGAIHSALTNLTRQSGSAVRRAQVVDWIRWAQQQAKPASTGERVFVQGVQIEPPVIERLPPAVERVIETFAQSSSTAILVESARGDIAFSPGPQDAPRPIAGAAEETLPTKVPRSRGWIVTMLVMLAALSALAVWAYVASVPILE